MWDCWLHTHKQTKTQKKKKTVQFGTNGFKLRFISSRRLEYPYTTFKIWHSNICKSCFCGSLTFISVLLTVAHLLPWSVNGERLTMSSDFFVGRMGHPTNWSNLRLTHYPLTLPHWDFNFNFKVWNQKHSDWFPSSLRIKKQYHWW